MALASGNAVPGLCSLGPQGQEPPLDGRQGGEPEQLPLGVMRKEPSWKLGCPERL